MTETAESTGSATDEERLLTGYTGRLALALSLGWLITLLGRQALPPLLPTLIDELTISPSQAGFALTLMWGLYAALMYPGGRLSDHLSRKTILVVGAAVSLAGFTLLSATRTYPMFLLSVGLVGVGVGLYFISTRALLSDLFVERRGQAFGMQASAGSIGSALGAAVAVGALAVASWRATFLPVLLVLLFVLFSIHRWVREPYVIDRVSLDLRDTGSRLFRTSRMRWLLVAYILFAFTLQAISGFLPTFLQAEKGFSAAAASGGFALIYVVGMFVGPIAGNLGDRASKTHISAGGLVIGTAGLALLVFFPSPAVIVLGIVVYAAGLRAFPPVMQAYLMDVFPDESMGGDLGALKSIYTGIGSLGPTYVGFVAQQWNYSVAFGGFVPLLVVSAGIIVWTVE
jgi:MFS family permease